MTCIAGIIDGGRVYIGGDSMGITGNGALSMTDPKVFRNGSFLIGVSGTARLTQLLHYKWSPPQKPDDVDTHRYLSTDVAESIRVCLKENGYSSVDSNVEAHDGRVLLGYDHGLYQLDGSYAVVRVADEYAAVGSGEEVALGALYATQGKAPRARIETALKAAVWHTPYVRGPFTVEVME